MYTHLPVPTTHICRILSGLDLYIHAYVLGYRMQYVPIPSVYTTGLIDFLLSAEPEAEVLRDRLVFKIGGSPPLYHVQSTVSVPTQ